MHNERILNLLPAIRALEAEVSDLELECKKKLAPYKDSLEALRKLNTACERCDGKGKVLRTRACAEDYRPDPNDPADWRTCNVCHGTEREPK